MQRKKSNRKKKGQALILAVVALSLFAFGTIGFFVDLSQIYAERQLAQNAADAAALAATMSLFDGTNTANGTFNNTFGNVVTPGSNPPRLTCGNNDNHTPCYYARQNGFDPSKGDTVYADFWNQVNAFAQEPGVQLSTDVKDPVPLLRVTIVRPVPATLMRLIGGGTTNVAAAATAAVTTNILPVPILILHPTMAGALTTNGKGNNPKINIFGGPQRSIQVNSCAGDTTGGKPLSVAVPSGGSTNCQSGSSYTWSGPGLIDLSQAGDFGKGGDFGNWGLAQTEPPPNPPLKLGSGKYDPGASPILDPLRNVPTPTAAGRANRDASACNEASGASTCKDVKNNAVLCPLKDPAGVATSNGCTVVLPGIYTSAGPLQSIKKTYMIFTPGIYYIQSGGVSFDSLSSGQTQNFPALVTPPPPYPTCNNADGETGCGVLFYLSKNGGAFAVSANANDLFLLGTDPLGTYQKILMFVDHAAPIQSHSLGGGGTWNVTGTIYATNTVSTILNSIGNGGKGLGTYQSLGFNGNPASGTVNGMIIVDHLDLGGTPNITMNLDPTKNPVRQVALVR